MVNNKENETQNRIIQDQTYDHVYDIDARFSDSFVVGCDVLDVDNWSDRLTCWAFGVVSFTVVVGHFFDVDDWVDFSFYVDFY